MAIVCCHGHGVVTVTAVPITPMAFFVIPASSNAVKRYSVGVSRRAEFRWHMAAYTETLRKLMSSGTLKDPSQPPFVQCAYARTL